MAIYKDGDKWRAVYRFTDWTGERKQTQKRGFKTKREAQAWEREQLNKAKADIDMTFESFIELYRTDLGARIKENTWETKDSIIDKKLIPYFGKKRMSEIQPKDVICWQNEMINHRDENGEPFSPVYLKTLHNQLSAIFNHAVKFYELSQNPAAKVGNMGKAKNKEKEFWTKEEYLKFADEMMDKPISFYAFEMLYWTGIRLGDDDDKIRLNQRKPSKYKGLSRFGPEKNLQRINKFMKERPIFYKNLIQMKENFRFYLRCFYCITKVVILQFNSENRTELARNG